MLPRKMSVHGGKDNMDCQDRRAELVNLIEQSIECRSEDLNGAAEPLKDAVTKGDAQAEPPGGIDAEPADHGLGRSRGGLTTKVHLACEQGQKPLSIVITAGQRGDSPQFQAVLDGIRVPRLGPGRPRTRPDRVLADKAYSSKA